MSTNSETVEYRYTGDASDLLAELSKVRASLGATNSSAKGAAQGFSDGLQSHKTAGDRFIAGLRQQVAEIGKTREELMRMRAAELGVGQAADPLIKKLYAADQGTKAIGRSSKMTAAEMAQLNYQFTDIVTSLQSGQSPFTVLMQQGGQIKDSLGGVGPALSKIAGLFSPIKLAAVGVIGTVAGIGAAMVAGYRETAEFNKTLLMTGNYSGLTADRVKSLATAIEAKTKATIADAREAVTAAAATGRFTQSVIGPAATAIAVVADRTGKKVAEVAQDFARVTDSATKFAVEQNRSMNFLTFAQYQYIRSLEATGQKEKAQLEVMRLITEQAGTKLPTELGILERSWNAVAKAASGAWDAMKDIGRPDTLADQLAKQQAQLDAARDAMARPKSTYSAAAREGRAAAIKADIAATNRALLNQENARIDAAAQAADEKRKIEEAEAGHGSRMLDLERAQLGLRSAAREAAFAQELTDLQRHQNALMLAGKPMADDELSLRRAAIERKQIQERISLLDQEAAIERKRSVGTPDEKIALEVRLLDISKQRLALKTQLANVDDGEAAFAAAVAASAEQARRENAQRQMDRISSAQSAAADLVETNKQLNLDLIRDDRQRAQAQLAYEEQVLRQRLQLHVLSADEQRKIEDDLATWRQRRQEQLNQLSKPRFDRLMEEWRDTSKRMREESDQFLTNFVQGGEDAFAQFARTGRLSVDSLFGSINEQIARRLFRDLAPKAEGFLRDIGAQLGFSTATAAGDVAGDLAQKQLAATTGTTAVAMKGLGTVVTPLVADFVRLSASVQSATAALGGSSSAQGAGSLFAGLFGGGYSGGLPSGLIPSGAMMAKGGVADRYGIAKFAKGDAFTNGVFNSPRLFRFGNGGANLGMLGEAGPEGVLPLKRGPGGRLGVSVYGQQGGAGQTIVNQSVTYNVAAGVSPAVLAAALEQNNQMLKSESEQGFMRGRDTRRALEAY